MIFDILYRLRTVLSEQVPDILMLDLDRGQLEQPEAFESLLFPAVLVGIPNISWTEKIHGNQDGDVLFTVKTCVLLPHNVAFYNQQSPDTYELLQDENASILLLEDAVHQQVTKHAPPFRVSSRYYYVNLNGSTVWVTEHTYAQHTYYSNVPRYSRKTTPTNPGISVILNR